MQPTACVRRPYWHIWKKTPQCESDNNGMNPTGFLIQRYQPTAKEDGAIDQALSNQHKINETC